MPPNGSMPGPRVERCATRSCLFMSRTPSIFGQPSWLVFARRAGDDGEQDGDSGRGRPGRLGASRGEPNARVVTSVSAEGRDRAARRRANPNRATLRRPRASHHRASGCGEPGRSWLRGCASGRSPRRSPRRAPPSRRGPCAPRRSRPRIPAGWPVVAFADDAGVYRIRSPATRFDVSGIQRPGGVGVFLSVYTRAQFARFYGTAPPARPADLFDTYSAARRRAPRPSRSSRRTARRSAASPRSRRPSRSASPTPRTSRPTSSRVTATAGRS